MITKAIVEEILTPSQIRVRIPTLNAVQGAKQSTPTDELSIATICTLPNAKNLVSTGDIVYVGFEDNDLSKPVILGHLLRTPNSDLFDGTLPDLQIRSLDVQYNTSLPTTTTIGGVSSNEIQYLRGVKNSLQQQIDDLQKQIDDIKESAVSVEALTNQEIDDILST